MKQGVLNAVRLLSGALLLLAAVYGYVCCEKTHIEGWIPVVAALAAALFTMPPLAARWRALTGSGDRTVNRLCHLFAFGAAAYFVFMGGNYLLSDPAGEYGEQITVLKKNSKERRRTYRSGRRYVARGKSYTVHYLEVEFPDGIRKQVQVAPALYNASRENTVKTVTMRRGFFGFPVIRSFGPPADSAPGETPPPAAGKG